VYVDNEDWRDWGPDGRGRDSKVEAGLQDLGLAKTGHEYNRCNQGGWGANKIKISFSYIFSSLEIICCIAELNVCVRAGPQSSGLGCPPTHFGFLFCFYIYVPMDSNHFYRRP
jgi:hypothetical protein